LYFTVASTGHGGIVIWQILRGDFRDVKEGGKRIMAASLPAVFGLALAWLRRFLPMVEVILYFGSLAFSEGIYSCFKIKGQLTFKRSALVLAMVISVVSAILFSVPSNIKEVFYISSLALILASEILLSNDKILCLIDRRIFLTAFRIKHCLCLVLIPRLWIGD
jgi:hypothetical protein